AVVVPAKILAMPVVPRSDQSIIGAEPHAEKLGLVIVPGSPIAVVIALCRIAIVVPDGRIGAGVAIVVSVCRIGIAIRWLTVAVRIASRVSPIRRIDAVAIGRGADGHTKPKRWAPAPAVPPICRHGGQCRCGDRRGRQSRDHPSSLHMSSLTKALGGPAGPHAVAQYVEIAVTSAVMRKATKPAEAPLPRRTSGCPTAARNWRYGAPAWLKSAQATPPRTMPHPTESSQQQSSSHMLFKQ